jgi:hypothetical protein
VTALNAPPRAPSPVRLSERATEAARVVEALHPGVMGPRLSRALGSPDQVCHVLDAKYEPGLKAVFLYQLGHQLVRGDLVNEDVADPGPGIAAPGVRASVFPHDSDLPSLPAVLDARAVGPLLADSAAGSPLVQRALRRRPRTRLLRYRPAKRATVRVSTGLADDAWIAKVYHDPAKAAAVARESNQLATTTGRGTLRLAPVVAHLPDLDVVVQQAVPGTPLDELLGGWRGRGSGLRAAVARAADAVADFHDGAVVAARHRSVDKELARFLVRAERVATVNPQLGDSLCELTHRLQRCRRRLVGETVGPVHGDCKPSQFLVDGPRMYLLDLDHCGIGDPAGDVGTFVATLRQLAARQCTAEASASTVELETLGEVFVSSYLRRRGDAGLAARIRWHEAVALQRKALRSFARSPLSRQPAALVAEAHRCLNGWEESA